MPCMLEEKVLHVYAMVAMTLRLAIFGWGHDIINYITVAISISIGKIFIQKAFSNNLDLEHDLYRCSSLR